MHISRPKVISQGLVKFYTIEDRENFGLKTNIEIHQVIDPTYQTPEYTAYVIDDVPDWLIALPLDYIADRLGSGEKLETAIKRALDLISVKPSSENIDLARRVFERWLNAYGAFTPLFLMPEVTDIYIRKLDDGLAVHINHEELGLMRAIIGWEPYELTTRRGLRRVTRRITVGDFDAISYLFRRFSIRMKTPITTHNPMPDLVDPEYRIRIAVTADPVGRPSPWVSIRVLPRRPRLITELIKNNVVSIDQAALLWLLADYKVPILFVGPMGAGKTTLQNAIAFLLVDKVIALVMDVVELYLPYHRVVLPMLERRAFARGIESIDKVRLINHSLRSGADIVLVNEARGDEEFRALLEAMTLGHGTITTFHAYDYEDAVTRLKVKGFTDAERFLGEAVVVEVGLVKESVRDEGGIVRVVHRRFVRSIRNADRHMETLVRDYGKDVIDRQLRYRVDFLSKALELNPTPEQLASLLYAFYKDPETILAVKPSLEAVESLSLPKLELPIEALNLDSEVEGLFKQSQ
ncbi:MAG: ATPase, T2SS/T4P/T4SS family [Vulcanisaeta sp.]|jgi:flagellar protein FlaI|nr:ATPase, T2SS/T4P/T4SS family [Vulcanisaeta sp.]